jgi:hypothetical protein
MAGLLLSRRGVEKVALGAQKFTMRVRCSYSKTPIFTQNSGLFLII